jgi:hypothetical protein
VFDPGIIDIVKKYGMAGAAPAGMGALAAQDRYNPRNEEATMAKKAKSDDWTEVDDDSQQARENPQAAEHEKAASAQQTELQWTSCRPRTSM